jgi:hypothetical protein
MQLLYKIKDEPGLWTMVGAKHISNLLEHFRVLVPLYNFVHVLYGFFLGSFFYYNMRLSRQFSLDLVK